MNEVSIEMLLFYLMDVSCLMNISWDDPLVSLVFYTHSFITVFHLTIYADRVSSLGSRSVSKAVVILVYERDILGRLLYDYL